MHVIEKACLSMSMVAQARQPSGWPVSSSAGTANLVWATTHGISSSGGSFHHKLL
ncbi:ash family protein [Sodalis ligni]|uniref:ash family protein n=1 Tax=Sodalis ligni TaxID=2697027 RepID=UPI00244184E3|nr:ash family protein [Sodalis ligni]